MASKDQEPHKRKSGGPKTPAGKAAAARNSMGHGLSVPVLSDPAWSPEVTALARKITSAKQPELFEAACRVAEAQVDLRRLRLYRERLMQDAELAPTARSTPAASQTMQSFNSASARERLTARIERIALSLPGAPNGESEKLAGLVRKLAALDRYERRALSRRKFAIRAFDALLVASRAPSPARSV